jgi:hypothetical protein
LYNKSNPTKFRQHRASIAQAKTLPDNNIIIDNANKLNSNVKNHEGNTFLQEITPEENE